MAGAREPQRIINVEPGGSHSAIREDAAINRKAIDRMLGVYSDADIVFLESDGDNSAATFFRAVGPRDRPD